MNKIKIKGYKRNNNSFGIRNHIIVMSSVCCANCVVEQIALLDDDVIPITHQHGCNHLGEDRTQVLNTLVGICNNTNVGGILLVGLGCENITVEDISKKIKCGNKIVRKLVIQSIGKKDSIFAQAKEYINEIKEFVSKQEKEEFDISELIIGLECGGSDTFSGITANPTVGIVSDKLVAMGATVILSEIVEMIGAENVLADKIKDKAIKERLFARIKSYVDVSKEMGYDISGVNPTPGNIKSGISSIEEKSLGCVAKAGHSEIKEFVKYAHSPRSKGLVVMDTPGNDPESVTGMVAGGAQIILFTTGLGTPLGNPIVPVIKISSNSKIYEHMRSFIDIDAGKIVEGTKIEDISEEIFEFLVQVCNGKQTASEINKCREFSINRRGITF